MITLTPEAALAASARDAQQGIVDEQYFALVHWLRSACERSGNGAKTVGITSCTPGVGVSTVATNLAIAAAQIHECKVLLLDVSRLRHSAVRPAGEGEIALQAALSDLSRAGQWARQSRVANLSVLTLIAAADLHSMSADGDRISEFFRALEGEYGFIVVDLPTVESSLCFVAAGKTNGVLLVMEAERTRGETAMRTKQRLIDADAEVLGVILNKHRRHLPQWLEARL